MDNLISIVVPVYNAQDYLAQCIESILEQSHTNFRLILVNDGCTDNSLAICEKYACTDSRISVYSQRNGGASSARNLGISKANGKYICFVDSDDAIVPLFLEFMLGKAVQYNVAVVNCAMQALKKNSKLKVTHHNKDLLLEGNEIMLKSIPSNNFMGFAWGKLISLDFINKYNIRFNTDLTYAEDLLFAFECLKRCTRYLVISNQLYLYRNNINSITNYETRNNEFDEARYFNVITVQNILYSYACADGSEKLKHLARGRMFSENIHNFSSIVRYNTTNREIKNSVASTLRKWYGSYLFYYPDSAYQKLKKSTIAFFPWLLRIYRKIKP